MWSMLRKRVHRTKISNVDEMKRRIDSEWAALRHAVIERAVGAFVRAEGGHFERVL